jgi:hypothetical protein
VNEKYLKELAAYRILSAEFTWKGRTAEGGRYQGSCRPICCSPGAIGLAGIAEKNGSDVTLLNI